jgi:hypothetical protein
VPPAPALKIPTVTVIALRMMLEFEDVPCLPH